jgi:hypothetical protein
LSSTGRDRKARAGRADYAKKKKMGLPEVMHLPSRKVPARKETALKKRRRNRI